MYEASKEMISFSEENTYLWVRLFGSQAPERHSYSSVGKSFLSAVGAPAAKILANGNQGLVLAEMSQTLLTNKKQEKMRSGDDTNIDNLLSINRKKYSNFKI